jgi:hypothetical protein
LAVGWLTLPNAFALREEPGYRCVTLATDAPSRDFQQLLATGPSPYDPDGGSGDSIAVGHQCDQLAVRSVFDWSGRKPGMENTVDVGQATPRCSWMYRHDHATN